MKVVRVYAGDDGESHFEDVDIEVGPKAESEGFPNSFAARA